jgi:hypothetical protein
MSRQHEHSTAAPRDLRRSCARSSDAFVSNLDLTVGPDYRVTLGITGNHQDAEDFVEIFGFSSKYVGTFHS